MSVTEWAEAEIDLVKKKIKEDSEFSHEYDYQSLCYDSALKAFKVLMSDEHSGMSMVITQSILNRLIDVKPLTPIEDTDDIWIDVMTYETHKLYQCSRMSSLFKSVYYTGRIKYSDNNRWIVQSTDDSKLRYHSSFVTKTMDELYPITMPYYPLGKAMTVYEEEFFVSVPSEQNPSEMINNLTIGLIYFLNQDNKQVPINKYYKRAEDGSKLIEINYGEYLARHQLLKNEQKDNSVNND